MLKDLRPSSRERVDVLALVIERRTRAPERAARTSPIHAVQVTRIAGWEGGAPGLSLSRRRRCLAKRCGVSVDRGGGYRTGGFGLKM
jgi:hypothetical protein